MIDLPVPPPDLAGRVSVAAFSPAVPGLMAGVEAEVGPRDPAWRLGLAWTRPVWQVGGGEQAAVAAWGRVRVWGDFGVIGGYASGRARSGPCAGFCGPLNGEGALVGLSWQGRYDRLWARVQPFLVLGAPPRDDAWLGDALSWAEVGYEVAPGLSVGTRLSAGLFFASWDF